LTHDGDCALQIKRFLSTALRRTLNCAIATWFSTSLIGLQPIKSDNSVITKEGSYDKAKDAKDCYAADANTAR
jgi:hypothetical protein